jgi:hypothetical protein
MSRFKTFFGNTQSKISELALASAPYISSIWRAISTGNIMEASPLALSLVAKEHYFQYSELIKDAVAAYVYVQNTGMYIDYLRSNSRKICRMDQLVKTHKEMAELVNTLNSDTGIKEQMKEQQIILNKTLIDYNRTHNISSYAKNIKTLSDRMFVKSWPGWYRIELASHINRMNMLIDETEIELLQTKKLGCRVRALPIDLPAQPIELDEQDEEEFFDALQSQQRPQQAGGKRKAKNLKKLKF